MAGGVSDALQGPLLPGKALGFPFNSLVREAQSLDCACLVGTADPRLPAPSHTPLASPVRTSFSLSCGPYLVAASLEEPSRTPQLG